MTALRRKLGRDLLRLRGQVVTIALVMACGVSSYVTLSSAYRSLVWARDGYYENHRFPDVFARAERAPRALLDRVATWPGVADVEGRISHPARIPMPGLVEPAAARVVSLPRAGGPALVTPYLRRGRMPDPARTDEALLLESFADEHGIDPGRGDARLDVVVGGVSRSLRIVGVALSPEFVFAIGAGAMIQDNRRFAVLWMEERTLASLVAMEGAFNDLVIRLQRGADERDVIDRLDTLLAPFGGRGAHGRDRQASHMMLKSELSQLEQFATVAPTIFLGVAAFLLNFVLARLVSLQRPQVAALKALGYRDREIALHYFGLALAISALGVAGGVGLGAWLGHGMLGLYRPYFHFPSTTYRLEADVVGTAIAVAVGATLLGTWTTVRSVAALAPAEAMLPETPASYRRTWPERLGLLHLLGPSGRMVGRELLRRPLRTTLSIAGLALAVSIMVTGRFMIDAVDTLMTLTFEVARREDVAVQFRAPLHHRAVGELASLPGVLEVEPELALAVRVRSGHHVRDIALTGTVASPDLARIVGLPQQVMAPPDRGVVLSAELARILEVSVGDRVDVEPVIGDRRTRTVEVQGTVADAFGLGAYMSRKALLDLFDEEGVVTGALLRVDPTTEADVLRRLATMPAVLSASRRQSTIDRFRAQTAETMTITTFIMTAFAVVIAVGVVYNNARIAIAMRARDLASLRVLGFTRAEISTVLLGELATQVLVAIPIGLVVGRQLAELMMATADRELFRFPVVVSARTYVFAAALTLVAALASALLVRRRLDQLDLTAVLKARD